MYVLASGIVVAYVVKRDLMHRNVVIGRKRGVAFAGFDRSRLAAGGGALDDGVLLNVVGVVGLDVDGNAVERALEGVLGRGVHHARLEYRVSDSRTLEFVSFISFELNSRIESHHREPS